MHCVRCSRVPLGCKGSCAECLATAGDDTLPPGGHVCTTVLDWGLGAWSGGEPPSHAGTVGRAPDRLPTTGPTNIGRGPTIRECQLPAELWQGAARQCIWQGKAATPLCTSNGVALPKPPQKANRLKQQTCIDHAAPTVDARCGWVSHPHKVRSPIGGQLHCNSKQGCRGRQGLTTWWPSMPGRKMQLC